MRACDRAADPEAGAMPAFVEQLVSAIDAAHPRMATSREYERIAVNSKSSLENSNWLRLEFRVSLSAPCGSRQAARRLQPQKLANALGLRDNVHLANPAAADDESHDR